MFTTAWSTLAQGEKAAARLLFFTLSSLRGACRILQDQGWSARSTWCILLDGARRVPLAHWNIFSRESFRFVLSLLSSHFVPSFLLSALPALMDLLPTSCSEDLSPPLRIVKWSRCRSCAETPGSNSTVRILHFSRLPVTTTTAAATAPPHPRFSRRKEARQTQATPQSNRILPWYGSESCLRHTVLLGSEAMRAN